MAIFLRYTIRQRSQSHFQSQNLCNKFSRLASPMLLTLFVLIVSSVEVTESGSLVKRLPGLGGDLPFTLETGYVGIGESEDVQLFYYFIESERSPKDDPLMVWLTGGPSCSALSDLLYLNGPFTINDAKSQVENEPILEYKDHSWTKVANIIFLDQPVGSGFSYAKSPEAYLTNDTSTAMDVQKFMRKWLVEHPQFLDNPLYIGGDSYTGIVVPIIVEEIYKGNEAGERPWMNIKGYLLGNPLTDRIGDYNSRIPFAHDKALLSDELYKSCKDNCHGDYWNIDPNNSLCIRDLQLVEKFLDRIPMSNILGLACTSPNTLNSNMFTRNVRSLDQTSVNMWSSPQAQMPTSCRDDSYSYSAVWANRRDVREALHIRKEFDDIEWSRCNDSMTFDFDWNCIDTKDVSYAHNVVSSVSYHQRLTDKHCRALVYSGDHDMRVPYLGTLKWIESLNLPVKTDWRPWFVDEQVAGYTMKYSKSNYNLTFATVKGAGHTAPEYKPKECLSMLVRWLANDTLDN